MPIGVLLKQVPDTTAKIGVSGDRVDESAVSKWSMSPYDEYALEGALRLKEEGGGDVVAITCGPARAAKMLTDAAAVGADSLLHILVEDLHALDSTQIQSLLAAALDRTDCDVVFCGKQAADSNSGSTGPGVALLIGASCVSHVSEVSADGGSYLALRASSGGDERVQISAPCVFAFDKGSDELRRPNVRGIMMAKKKGIETISSGDLGISLDNSRVTVMSHSAPPEKPPGQKFEGADSVATVVGKLRDEANII
ncbi:MAG: electron transfer flavoprotein subunit beta/FixA family protein [Candidatus Thalassarchaeum sp.]